MVVRMLAPIISENDSLKVSRPAPDRPTTITVAADEDCRADVTATPEKIPFSGFWASELMKLRIR